MKKHIVFIVNPFSGTSKKGNLEPLIRRKLDQDQYTYSIKYTEAAGHATILAQEARDKRADVVVAVGGDGSVNEVAQALVHSDTVLGVLPGGSGNGFAMHVGIGRSIANGIKVINSGRPRVIDTCTVNDRFFINVAGVGFDARIAFMTKLNSKRGFLPYFLTTLRQAKGYRPVSLSIEIDGDQLEGRYALAAVANASMFGYYFTIAPPARLDDGVMDLVLIKDASLVKYAMSSHRFLNRSLHKSPITDFYQGQNIKLSVSESDYLHVDGEGMEAPNQLEFAIVPQSLKVMFPSLH